jgi:hypothetical protein
LSVCVCVCVSVCTHTHTHTHYIYIYTYIYIYSRVHTHTHTHIHTHTHTQYVYIYIYIYIYILGAKERASWPSICPATYSPMSRRSWHTFTKGLNILTLYTNFLCQIYDMASLYSKYTIGYTLYSKYTLALALQNANQALQTKRLFCRLH